MAGIDRVLSPRVPGTVVTTPAFEAQAQLFVSQLEALFYLVLGERDTGDNLEKRGANYDYTSYVEGTRGLISQTLKSSRYKMLALKSF